jgi:hypothetical protein
MVFMFFYFVSVIASFKLGAHLVRHPEAPLEWAQRAANWLKQ